MENADHKTLIFVKGDKNSDFNTYSQDFNTYFLFYDCEKDVYVVNHFGDLGDRKWNDRIEFDSWDDLSDWVYHNLKG